MVRIQTDEGYIEIKEGTAFPVTYSVADVRDMSKRTGNTSKTVTAVGSAENNRILGFLFDINESDYSFNVNQKVICQVLEDDVNVMQDAIMQLVSVSNEQKSVEHYDDITYSLVIKSQQADLFTAMDNKELTDLDFTELQHTFNATNVIASFDYDANDGYVYVRGMSDDLDMAITDFRPAIYLKKYLDKIHAVNGYSYEVQDLPIFDKLIIPFNGDNAVGNYNSYHAQASKATFSSDPATNITSWTEIEDQEGIFNPTTGVVTSPFYFGIGSGMTFTINYSLDVVLDNSSGADAYLTRTNLLTNALEAVSFGVGSSLKVYKNGALVSSPVITLSTEAEFSNTDNPLPNGDNVIATLTGSKTFAINNILQSDTLTFRLVYNMIPFNSFTKWRDAYSASGTPVTVTPRIDMDSILMDVNFTVNSFGFGQTTDMNLFVPKKVKQKDLIKSFTTMFYLMAIPDEDNANRIIYQPRNEWLDSGASVDWSEKLAKDRTQELQFLPELSAKKLKLSYKEDKDSYNTAYKDNINEVYGQVDFTYDSEFVKGDDVKTLSFSATPMVKDSTGSIVPTWAGVSPKNNIRILIHNGSVTADPYNIYNYGSVGETGVVTHPNVGHFDDAYNPTFDLNFGICDFYFYDNVKLTNNNLFNLYWRRAVSQINNGKMLTAYFDLDAFDIFKMRLNDKIYIDNSWWNINKIIDYDVNADALTKVELISVDDYIDLPLFRRKRPVFEPIPWGQIASQPIHETNIYSKNINLSPNVKIIGKGNVVDNNLSGLLIGSNTVANTNEDIINISKSNNSEPRIWKAQVKQSGTDAPIINVLENSLNLENSTIYNGVGLFEIDGFDGNLDGQVSIENNLGVTINRIPVVKILTTSSLEIATYNLSLTLTNGLLNDHMTSIITVTKYD